MSSNRGVLTENEDESNETLVLGNLSNECSGQAKEILQNKGEEELIDFFFMSVQFGNLRDVNDCLNCGISPNIRQTDSSTALHIAAERGNVQMGRLLLSRKTIDIHLKTSTGYTALHIACFYGKRTFVKLLLDNNADPNCTTINDKTPLHVATIKQNYETISLLLNYKANPNVLDSFCDTPLTNCVIRKPNFMIAKLLVVDYKADTNLHCTGQMHIMLNLAQSCLTENHLKFVHLLIENGMDVHVSHPVTNRNALHFAAISGYGPMISLLLECGVSTTQKDVWNRTPLDVAKQHGIDTAIDIFLAREVQQNTEKNMYK